MRNHILYELGVFAGTSLLVRYRDSMTLLRSSVDSLARTLCPELGGKGALPHTEMRVSNLQERGEEIITYLRQDILLLGGVMQKAQAINWENYEIDVEDVMTISALSLKIFRKQYLPESFEIKIPTRKEDSFFRRGYYGGHVDIYKPYGEELFYYDVNSLYPFVMKTYPMPSGAPVWYKNLAGVELAEFFGFIEAYIVCPKTIEHPFLPYKDPKV